MEAAIWPEGKPAMGCKDPVIIEMCDAEVILGYVQRKFCSEDIRILEKDKGQMPNSGTIYKLELFLDETELLRVGGRLHRAPVSQETRHPVIVPRRYEIM